jgi:putative flippase GtrA
LCKTLPTTQPNPQIQTNLSKFFQQLTFIAPLGKYGLRKSTIMLMIAPIQPTFMQLSQLPQVSQLSQPIKFAIVGGSGIVVNMAILIGLQEVFEIPLMIASIVAIEVSIISNFLLNDSWTFKETSANSRIARFISFNTVSLGGMMINIAVLSGLVSVGIHYIIGNLIGILIAFAWNYIINKKVTWKKKETTSQQ